MSQYTQIAIEKSDGIATITLTKMAMILGTNTNVISWIWVKA